MNDLLNSVEEVKFAGTFSNMAEPIEHLLSKNEKIKLLTISEMTFSVDTETMILNAIEEYDTLL